MEPIISMMLHRENGEVVDMLRALDIPLLISEYEKVVIKIIVSFEDKPIIQIGDYYIPLHISNVDRNNLITYEIKESKIFQNYMGTVFFEIITSDLCFNRIKPVNIYGRKITSERAIGFLKYLSERADISAICFSPSKHMGKSDKKTNNISEKINSGLKVLEYFLSERGRFQKDPCSSVKCTTEVTNHSSYQVLDDRSIAYISRNPDTLTRCDVSSRDLTIRGQHYQVNRVERSVHTRNTNVFENQVILAFAHHYLRFLTQIVLDLEKRRSCDLSILNFNGEEFVSIDRILEESGLLLNVQFDKITLAIKRTKQSILFIEQYLSCSINSNITTFPVPTQQVISKTHYFGLYRFLRSYYDVGEPNWDGIAEAFSLRSIPKIYEFVCLVGLIEQLKKIGFIYDESIYLDDSLNEGFKPINELNNFYRFRRNDEILDLWYEPNTSTFSSEKIIEYIGYSLGDVKIKRNIRYKPDFVFVHNINGKLKTHVIDAKYSNFSVVRDRHLPECTSKYINYLRTYKKGEYLSIDSLTLLFSENHSEYISNYHTKARLFKHGCTYNPEYIYPPIGGCAFNPEMSVMLSCILGVFFEKKSIKKTTVENIELSSVF